MCRGIFTGAGKQGCSVLSEVSMECQGERRLLTYFQLTMLCFFLFFFSEIFPRDLNLKDKFIKHFTDYKRCARLLKRLAVSPLCSQTEKTYM
ncbi:hypothetical protein G4228_014102 [Cervus hanglu yarkandensis]|nr:hypothetical protein G4228_014102 [Cervus hanglu yarkandensis]